MNNKQIRPIFGVSSLVIILVLAACSPSTATPTPTAISTDTSQPKQTATPTLLDPCVLVDSQEATSFTGNSFGQRQEETTSGGGRICVYGSNTAHVFEVFLGQEKDAATADADVQSFISDLQANLAQLTSEGMNITKMPNFADGAVMADASFSIGGTTLNGRAMGVRKGTIFFGFS